MANCVSDTDGRKCATDQDKSRRLSAEGVENGNSRNKYYAAETKQAPEGACFIRTTVLQYYYVSSLWTFVTLFDSELNVLTFS